MSVVVSSIPNAASKLGTEGGLISISSTALPIGGRRRIPVAKK